MYIYIHISLLIHRKYRGDVLKIWSDQTELNSCNSPFQFILETVDKLLFNYQHISGSKSSVEADHTHLEVRYYVH